MISVAEKIKVNAGFPLEVFGDNIRESLLSISKHYNIPKDFLGAVVLFTIGSLSGNLYVTELGTKAIVYIMLIGPSGTGKTPAYKRVCGDIIKSLRETVHDDHIRKLKEWKERKALAKDCKREFTEIPPNKPVRMMEEATLEAVLKEAEFSPAGQGLVYDEGARMFNGMNQYKKDSSSTDAINEMWNGELIEIYRADSDRNRHIKNPAVSLLVGMQKNRMEKHFTEDIIHSGLPYRFLMTESSYVPIQETVDYFDEEKKEMCESWQETVRGLFWKGVEFTRNSEPIKVEFDSAAKMEYNRVKGEIAAEQNKYMQATTKEEARQSAIASMAKLQAYISRLALLLAIMDDHTGPVIRERHVSGAYKLYKYYKKNAERILGGLFRHSLTGLTESDTNLLDALPDEFTAKQAEDTCVALGLGNKFFHNSMARKYSKGWIRKMKKGVYEKQ